MSEKRFITSIFIEGLIITFLSLCVLILPKLTYFSNGVMLSTVFLAYGLYKIITSIIYGKYKSNLVFCYLSGILLITLGILLLLVPKISLLWLIAIIGVYFLLDSMSLKIFAAQIRSMYNFWQYILFSSCIAFITGLIIILGLPAISFGTVVMLSGFSFLVKGMAKTSLYLINRNSYN